MSDKMPEMKTLNGYEVVDGFARETIANVQATLETIIANQEKIAKSIGDTETALDTIIAIQEQLIAGGGGDNDDNGGSATTITFYVAQMGQEESKEFTAEEGMTWEEFVNSDYNTDGFVLFEDIDEGVNRMLIEYNGMFIWTMSNYDDGLELVAATDLIMADNIYGLE